MDYNKKHNITPKSIIKGVRDIIEITKADSGKGAKKKSGKFDMVVDKDEAAGIVSALEKEMKQSASFSGNEVESVRLDFSELRERGLEYIQELSGDVWTDYNAHDPGVTILEQLCYALTDSAFRMSLPVNDLLVPGENLPVNANANAFFPPSAILSSHPVTIQDYRKLIIQMVWYWTIMSASCASRADLPLPAGPSMATMGLRRFILSPPTHRRPCRRPRRPVACAKR